MTTLTITDTLVAHQCPTCGVWHGIPDKLNERALENRGPRGRQIYCPNGHTWHYVGKTEAQKLQEEVERLERVNASKEESLRIVRQQRDAHKRSAAAQKGQATRARKRAQAALCPVEGCGRSFIQMKRHLAAKHPGFSPVEEADARDPKHAHA